MTSKEKSLLITVAAAALGIALFERHQASTLLEQVRSLETANATATAQLKQLKTERDDANNRLTSLGTEAAATKPAQTTAELLKLRGEVARLRSEQSAHTPDPFTATVLAETARAARLNELLSQMPEKRIPELQWLTLADWLDAAKDADLESDAGVRKALSRLRRLAKSRLYPDWQKAFQGYLENNGNQLPADLAQLKPFFEKPVDDSILARYQLIASGSAASLKPGDYIMSERAPADSDFDERYEMGLGHSRWWHF
jgi:hypothetical protein